MSDLSHREEKNLSLSRLHSGCTSKTQKNDTIVLASELTHRTDFHDICMESYRKWQEYCFCNHSFQTFFVPAPFAFLKDIPSRSFIACLFLYLKMPRPVQFKTSILYSIYHALFLLNPSTGPWTEWFWIGKEIFQLLSHFPVLGSFFLFSGGKEQGCWYPGQISLMEEMPLWSSLLTISAPLRRPCACMNTNVPTDLRLIDKFFHKPLGVDLPTTEFSRVKDTLQFEPTSNAAFGGDHTALHCQRYLV